MSDSIQAYACLERGGALQPYEYDPGPIGADEVEVAVDYCGICHSDLSVIDNAWNISRYPVIPGHEAVGRIVQIGKAVTNRKIGQYVGVGWFASSCLTCHQCMSGSQNLCDQRQATIVGHHGGFADRVRCQAAWAVPLPDGVDLLSAGPLFCGGITVFNPLVIHNVRPTDRVGVVGIGGLGHMALKFLHHWGCEITAFSTTADKEAQARELGAHHFVATNDDGALEQIAGSLDMILVTVNVDLNWPAYAQALKTGGRLHVVGAVPQVTLPGGLMLGKQSNVSGSPLGSPATVATMLDFCARHQIQPVVEQFAMSDVNQALEHLRAGKARYRIVLAN